MENNVKFIRLDCEQMYSKLREDIASLNGDLDPNEETVLYAVIGRYLLKESINILLLLYTCPTMRREITTEGKKFFLSLGTQELPQPTYPHCQMFINMLRYGKINLSQHELPSVLKLAQTNTDGCDHELEPSKSPLEGLHLKQVKAGLQLIRLLAMTDHSGSMYALEAFNNKEIVSKYDLLARTPALLGNILLQPAKSAYDVTDEVSDLQTFKGCVAAIRGETVPIQHESNARQIYHTLSRWVWTTRNVVVINEEDQFGDVPDQTAVGEFQSHHTAAEDQQHVATAEVASTAQVQSRGSFNMQNLADD